MKITYILPVYWPAIGGCELHTHELVRRLSERHDIQVITQITKQEDKPGDLWFGTLVNPIPKSEVYFDNKAKVIPIMMHPLERSFLYPFVRYHHRMEKISMEVIRRIFQRKIFNLIKDSDLIHCIHNGASFYGYTALQCARKLNIPFVFTPVLHLSKESGWDNFKQIIGKGSKNSFSSKLTVSPLGYHDLFWLKVCENSDALVTMTEFERSFFISHGIKNNKVHHVGIAPIISENFNGLPVRKKYGIDENQIVVLFIGRKVEAKGIEELCKAARIVWEKHKNVFFLFAGPSEGRAKAIFGRYRDNRIINIDSVSVDEKSDLLDSCDIFCMPSFHESLGGVFLEAWTFGKPIIGADIPPLRELTENGTGGMLISQEPEDIAEKIIILIENKHLRHRLGTWGQERAKAFNWDVISEKVQTIYSRLLENENSKVH